MTQDTPLGDEQRSEATEIQTVQCGTCQLPYRLDRDILSGNAYWFPDHKCKHDRNNLIINREKP